jgi:capsular exopolysaccharide synthesis family protein
VSKIYEALLRAELERLGTNTDKPAPDPAQTPEASLARLQSVAAAAAVQQQTPAAEEPGFPIDRVAIREWKPQVDRLPSLLKVAAGAEQFRSLRARMYEYRDLNKLKSILVCSGLPQEGKSFVAANLALILAQGRSSRVLLIDADVRRYTLDKLLGAPHTPGLAEYLMGKAEVLDVMQRPDLDRLGDRKIAAALSNITFIPAGAGGDSVVDLGTSGRFAQLMQQVEPYFDWVIVDSSPVNLVSDAVHYAHDCDGVLLVVRSGTTKYEMAQKAVAEFKQGSVIGVVLNGSTDAPRAGYYGYGYDTEAGGAQQGRGGESAAK